jgi:hypothetical protein
VVARDDLVRLALRSVEQDEVLDDVEQALLVQHAFEQHWQQRLVLRRFGVVLVQPLPAVEVLLAGRDGAVLRVVAVRDHDQRVPVEQVRNGVQVVGVILLVGGVDVDFEALELDEHQRQAVDEADHVRPAQPELAPHPEFAHRQVSVLLRVFEVDEPQAPVHDLAGRVAVLHRHALAQQLVLVFVQAGE